MYVCSVLGVAVVLLCAVYVGDPGRCILVYVHEFFLWLVFVAVLCGGVFENDPYNLLLN